jgi:hypothetical protein
MSQALSPLILFVVSFLTHMFCSLLNRSRLWRLIKFSLCAAVSLLVFCAVLPSHCDISGHLTPHLQPKETNWAIWSLPGSPSLCHSLQTLKAVSWDNYRACPMCFPFLKDVLCCLTTGSCIPSYRMLFYVFHLFHEREVNMALVNPQRAKVETPSFSLNAPWYFHLVGKLASHHWVQSGQCLGYGLCN